MIRHIVLWNLRGDTPRRKTAAASPVKQVFEGPRGKVPGLLRIEIGIDSSRVDYACKVVPYSAFESQQALDAYAYHPEHLRAKETLSGLRTARHQVDYRT